MDWLPIVSLTVGISSIVVAVASIWLSITTHSNTKDVLAEIDKRAAVIGETVKGTQEKLIDTVTALASPPKASEQEIMLKAFLPLMVSNPEVLERLAEMGKDAPPGGPGAAPS